MAGGFRGDAAANADRRLLVVICLVAVAVRLVAAAVLSHQNLMLDDAGSFRKAAENLLHFGQIRDWARMPGYPILIILSGGGRGQLMADIALSSFAAVLAYVLAWQLWRDRWIAALSGFGAALYPPLVFFSVVGLSETLFLTLVMATFYGWYRGRFLFAAICAVLAILTRPVFDLAAIFFVVYFSLFIHRLSWTRTLRNVAIYACVYVALMTPWWVHNYIAYGTFVRFDLALGTVLYAGNNPMNHTGGGNIGEDYDTAAFDHTGDLVARDRALRDAAIHYMIENPKRTGELAVLKFMRIWRLWPHHEAYSNWLYEIGLALSFGPVCLFALIYLVGWGRFELWPISPLLLFIAYYTAIHMLLIGTIRFRIPFEPYLLIFAAAGLVHCVRALRRFQKARLAV